MTLRFLECAAATAASVGVLLFVLAHATRREPRTGRHARAHGVYHGKPTEVRRHRRKTHEHTWPGTHTACTRPAPAGHLLDETDPAAVQLHAARYEDTGEITQADLEALLGPRPALTGASA